MAAKKKDPYADMLEMMVSAAEDAGIAAVPYNDLSGLLKVIPVPSLAVQYLINSNGWPLGRMTSSAGPAKSYKSTFAYQLMAWCIQAGGTSNLIDTENKPSGETLAGMINATGLPENLLAGRCVIGSATTMEQWQANLLNQAAKLEKLFVTPDQCKIPSITVLDSLTGVNSQAGTDELIENEGGVAQSRVGQQNAKALYQFMRDGARRSMAKGTAERWPTLLHLVNHERDRGDGLSGKQRSGGVSQDYYTSLDLTFKVGGMSAFNQSPAKVPGCGRDGAIVTITVRYSSLGPDGKDQNITVPMLATWEADENGVKTRRVACDWFSADTFFLTQHYNKIKNVFDMESKYVRGHGVYAKSKALGFSDFVPAQEFGAALQANTDVMRAITNELGIPQRESMIFLPGVMSINEELTKEKK